MFVRRLTGKCQLRAACMRKSPVRVIIAVFLTLVLAGLAFLLIRYGSSSRQPANVILIIIDTLRTDAVGFYNQQSHFTPHIDQLASESLVFHNAISSSPWTMPSVISILTALPPAVHGQMSVRTKLSDNVTTTAEYLKERGYVTCAIGDNKFLTEMYNVNQGFDVYDFYPKNTESGWKTISTKAITRKAKQWISENDGDPFYMWLHYFDPHLPYSPPAKYLPEQPPPERLDKHFNKLNEIRKGTFTPTPKERQWIRQLYHGEVRYVDDCVGQFLEHLKDLGIYDNSLIILTSDHGEEFWDHNGFEHGHTVYNELLSVPLFIKLPKSARHQTFSRLVSLESILPTVLDVCRIDYDRTLYPADSLAPLWIGPDTMGPEKPVISSGLLYNENQVSITFKNMKYVQTAKTHRESFYDLLADPLEMHNLAGSAGKKMKTYQNILIGHYYNAQTLKDRHNIKKHRTLKLDEATIKHLKSLGYIE